MSMLLSACLIVKNEEANLARCLNSVWNGTVDEIIVVDTGSTDKTKEIAKQWGCRVFDFEWCDDFAAARNFALDQARSDYIFWTDGDDELVLDQYRSLSGLCRDWGAGLRVHSQGLEGSPVSSLRWAIFPNYYGIRFYKRLHEEPKMPPEADQIPICQFAHIVHHGYENMTEEQGREKAIQRLKILSKMLLEESDSIQQAIYHYDRARLYAWLKDPEYCLDDCTKAIQSWHKGGAPRRDWSTAFMAYAYAADALLTLERFEEVLAVEASCPPDIMSAELLLSGAKACIMLERRNEAAQRLYRAIHDPGVKHDYLVTEASGKASQDLLAQLGYPC